jgi:nucleotide-binding universal stress UspA family protein
MTKRFVVGWDGSAAARGALAWALDRVDGGPNRLVAGPPARRIVESADGASLLVVGAGHRRARTGAVTKQIVYTATTPVAVVR